MNTLSASIFSWGPIIVQIVLLSLQIYTYRRTNHYSLVLLAVGTNAVDLPRFSGQFIVLVS
jgi:hypothetical protein